MNVLKHIILILSLSLFQFGKVFAQTNLVPNFSFEQTTICPSSSSQIYRAAPWFQPCIQNHTDSYATWGCSTSDWFDVCATNIAEKVPSNVRGFQNQISGLGYAGIEISADTFNYREYIEVGLLDTLEAGKVYCVEFYVSPAEKFKEVISNIGLYFSNDSLLDTSLYYNAIDYVVPQIENPSTNIISDTLNWTLISANYTALGGEKFITIGNFHKPINTNIQPVSWGTQIGAFYYIEDVSVIDCSTIGINELPTDSRINFYPNPTQNQISFKLDHQFSGMSIEVSVCNIAGALVVRQNQLAAEENLINLDLPNGTYFISIRPDDPNFRIFKGKFTVIH